MHANLFLAVDVHSWIIVLCALVCREKENYKMTRSHSEVWIWVMSASATVICGNIQLHRSDSLLLE